MHQLLTLLEDCAVPVVVWVASVDGFLHWWKAISKVVAHEWLK